MLDTSLDAFYNKVLPRLGERQRQVLEVFTRNPRLNWTNRELARELGWDTCQLTGRVNELRKEGVLTEACKRPCIVTGNIVYSWKLAGA